ncbi:MAG: M56 family metallopeptidase, partial [Gemmataceae bacterium]
MIETASIWLLHSLLGGGLLLALVWRLMSVSRQPVRSLQLGRCGVLAGLVLAALALLPAWWTIPLPVETAAAALEEPPVQSEPPALIANAPALVPAPADEAVGADPVPEAVRAEEPLPALSLEQPGPVELIEPDVPVEPLKQPEIASVPAVVEVLPAAETTPSELIVPSSSGPGFKDSLAAAARLFVQIYAAVVVFLLLRWLAGYLALRRLLRRAVPAPDAVAEKFARFSDKLPATRLLVSMEVRVPFSCGIVSRAVVLPASLCGAEAAGVLPWVFAHELAHLRRRDAWTQLLITITQLIYFPLPWFHRIKRQVQLCQEYLADAAASEHVEHIEEYAQFLLNLRGAPAIPVRATGVSGNTSDLYRRIAMLLQSTDRVERSCPRWWTLATAGGLLSLAVIVSGLGVHAAVPVNEDKPSKPPAEKKEVKTPAEVAAELRKALKEIDPATHPEEFQKRIREAMEQLHRNLPKQGVPGQPAFVQQKEMAEAIRRAAEAARAARMQFQPGFPGQPAIPVQPPYVPFVPQPGVGVMVPYGPQTWRERARLGVQLSLPSDLLIEQLNLTKNIGLIVDQVVPDMPAAKAGLKPHDILLEFDGKPVPSDQR